MEKMDYGMCKYNYDIYPFNGSSTGEFNFERGLCPRDPLYSFLFIIASRGLNIMMNATIEAWIFTRYKVGRSDTVSITHLQFTDDTLLLGEKGWANVRTLKVVLNLLEFFLIYIWGYLLEETLKN